MSDIFLQPHELTQEHALPPVCIVCGAHGWTQKVTLRTVDRFWQIKRALRTITTGWVPLCAEHRTYFDRLERYRSIWGFGGLFLFLAMAAAGFSLKYAFGWGESALTFLGFVVFGLCRQVPVWHMRRCMHAKEISKRGVLFTNASLAFVDAVRRHANEHRPTVLPVSGSPSDGIQGTAVVRPASAAVVQPTAPPPSDDVATVGPCSGSEHVQAIPVVVPARSLLADDEVILLERPPQRFFRPAILLPVLAVCAILAGVGFLTIPPFLRMLENRRELGQAMATSAREQPVVKPVQEAPPEPVDPKKLQLGKGIVIDFLKLIDPKIDAVVGHWELKEGELRMVGGFPVPRFQLPYQPPEEYDYIVTFSRPGLRNGTSLIMPNKHGSSFHWEHGFNGGRHAYLCAGGNINVELQPPMKPNVRTTVTMQIRKGEVRSYADGLLLLAHKTDCKDLHTDQWRPLRDTSVLGIACDDPVVYHEIKVIEVNGPGRKMREAK